MTFLFAAAGSVATTLLLPNKYEAHLKILVKNARSDVPLSAEPTINALGRPFGDDFGENQIDSEIELLTSKELMNQIVTECDLIRSKPSLWERLGLKEMPATQEARVEEAGKALAKDLSIEAARGRNIIVVKYASNSPERAAVVLRKLRDLYLKQHRQLHRTTGTYDGFKSPAAGYQERLRNAEKQLSSFHESTNVVSLAQQKQETVQKLTESRAKLLETEAFLKGVNERIARVQRELKSVKPHMPTDRDPLRQTLENELARARVDLAGGQGRREMLAGQVKRYEEQVARVEGIASKYDEQLAGSNSLNSKAVAIDYRDQFQSLIATPFLSAGFPF